MIVVGFFCFSEVILQNVLVDKLLSSSNIIMSTYDDDDSVDKSFANDKSAALTNETSKILLRTGYFSSVVEEIKAHVAAFIQCPAAQVYYWLKRKRCIGEDITYPEVLYGGATTEGHQVQIPKGERSGGNERQ